VTDDLPPIDPEGPPRAEFSPPAESGGNRFLAAAGRGCLGTVAFIVALLVFGTAVVANQALGLALSIVLVFALFAKRKRSGPSPMLGAVAVGVTIAMILAGSCAILMMLG
jgi:hypothetical protein